MTEVFESSVGASGDRKGMPPEVAAQLGGTSEVVANYRIQGVLGAGASAVVYLADDVRTKTPVALKIPLPHVLLDPECRDRFVAEATMLASLEHPNLVDVYEVGISQPVPFIAMERCDSSDLGQWLERLAENQQPLPPWEEVAELIATVAQAVDYVHEQGITHRDLKPANILLQKKEAKKQKNDLPGSSMDNEKLLGLSEFTVKVSDFGLSKSTDAELTGTRSSLMVGTPLYMAPEQVDWRQGKALDDKNSSAADIYSLGAILYQLLTGRTPIQGRHYYEVLEEIRKPRIVPVSRLRADLPKAAVKRLEKICAVCLNRNPFARYQNAAALAEDLRRCVDGKPILARSVGALQSCKFWLASGDWLPVAGRYAIACSLLVTFWLAFTGLGAYQFSIVSKGEHAALLKESLTLFLTSIVPMGLIGWGCLKEVKWAAMIGLVLNTFNLLASILGMAGNPLMFKGVYALYDGYFCFTIHLFIFLTYSILHVLFLLVFLSTRQRNAWSRVS